MARFIKVKCKCGNEQVLFERSSNVVKCLACEKIIARPTGGKVALEHCSFVSFLE